MPPRADHLFSLLLPALVYLGIPSAMAQSVVRYGPADQYLFELPAHPEGTIGARPPPTQIVPEDYPVASLRRGESGVVALRLLIGEGGDLQEVQVAESSGSGDLDAAAVALLRKRGRHAPGTRGGAPVALWEGVTVIFLMIPNALDMSRLRCYPRPILGFTNVSEEILLQGALVAGGTPQDPATTGDVTHRWFYADESGHASEMILRVESGWVRIDPIAVEQIAGNIPFPRRESGGCWYYSPWLG